VPVLPPVVGGQQVGERVQQILVTAGAELEHRDARRGVRHEHMQQPFAAARRLAGEISALPGYIVYYSLIPGMHLENGGFHPERYAAYQSSRRTG
jgi:hypothetical protein